MKHLCLPCTLCILVLQRTQSAPCFLSITVSVNIVSPVMETSSWLAIHGNRMPALVAFATMGLFSAFPSDVQLPDAKCQCFVRDSAVHSVWVSHYCPDANWWLYWHYQKCRTITMLGSWNSLLKKTQVPKCTEKRPPGSPKEQNCLCFLSSREEISVY